MIEQQLISEIKELREMVSSLSNQFSHLQRLADETRALVGPFGTPMPGGSMLVQTIHGTKYLIDPNDRIMAPQLIVYRQWEPDLSLLFLNNVNPDSVVIDVGANFGYFSCLAASKMGTSGSGQVWAFEPNPRLLPLLEDNCWRINWSMAPINVRPVAVGERAGCVTLSVPRNGAANASLTDAGEGAENVTVDLVSLDEIIPANLSVDLMKIDVEGHELGVLRGARSLMARSPNLHIVMEWSLEQLRAAGTDVGEMIEFLSSAGLVTKRVPKSGNLADAEVFDPKTLQAIAYDNIILSR